MFVIRAVFENWDKVCYVRRYKKEVRIIQAERKMFQLLILQYFERFPIYRLLLPATCTNIADSKTNLQ
jgi:hypothetical protein